MTTTAPKVFERKAADGSGDILRDIAEPSGTYYRAGTPRIVIDALERARANRSRIRLFTGDGETGASWHDENDVTGLVGRTTGGTHGYHSPILLANDRSMGGGIILTDCIVRLMVDGREVYRHPKYQDPVITLHDVAPITIPNGKTLTVQARIDGKEWANFATLKQAERWKAFMEGKRMSK